MCERGLVDRHGIDEAVSKKIMSISNTNDGGN